MAATLLCEHASEGLRRVVERKVFLYLGPLRTEHHLPYFTLHHFQATRFWERQPTWCTTCPPPTALQTPRVPFSRPDVPLQASSAWRSERCSHGFASFGRLSGQRDTLPSDFGLYEAAPCGTGVLPLGFCRDAFEEVWTALPFVVIKARLSR